MPAEQPYGLERLRRVAEMLQKRYPPRSPSEQLHDYVDDLAARYGPTKHPTLTLIRGGRDDAS